MTTANSKAREINIQLLQSLISAFAQNPKADLAALLPSDYNSYFPREPPAQKKTESKLAKLNRQTIDALLRQFATYPDRSIKEGTSYPLTYSIQRSEQNGKAKRDIKIEQRAELPPDHFASMLDEGTATSYDIAAPLSAQVENMLHQQELSDPQDPVSALKNIIRNSRFLWSGTAGGRFVAKLSDNVAVRVTGGEQANHYAAYELLAEQAPHIPAPRPHGLIQLGHLSIMFFSYVPGVTLEKAWLTLPHQQKKSIQTQLDRIFAQVREVPQDGRPIGMVNGQGVVDLRALNYRYRPEKPIKTVAEFEEFIFSYRPWVTKTYVQFLQQLLPKSRFEESCVFTHGDLRPANIMVDTDETGNWKVTGIIDWEEAGFYPVYWESVTATRTFLANDDNDWYLMLPASISPMQYPTYWLVDRLWESMIQQLAEMDKHVKKRKPTPQQS